MFYEFIFRWLGMLMRSCLAAIDFNENIHRPQKTSASGEGLFKEKVLSVKSTVTSFSVTCTKVDRTGRNRTVVPVRMEKNHNWQTTILEQCIEGLRSGQIQSPKVLVDFVLIVLTYHTNYFSIL